MVEVRSDRPAVALKATPALVVCVRISIFSNLLIALLLFPGMGQANDSSMNQVGGNIYFLKNNEISILNEKLEIGPVEFDEKKGHTEQFMSTYIVPFKVT